MTKLLPGNVRLPLVPNVHVLTLDMILILPVESILPSVPSSRTIYPGAVRLPVVPNVHVYGVPALACTDTLPLTLTVTLAKASVPRITDSPLPPM